METIVLNTEEKSIQTAANALKRGQVVAIPTETVYGLAANAFDQSAVARIFEAKGRPQDNPLIVHVSDMQMLRCVAIQIPQKAQELIDAFCPGPITVILPKSDQIPLCVTAGLDSVGVRMPMHAIAREIIQASGVPLAAPSANRSGSPSPTEAGHVYADLNGKIPYIVDGGACAVGVESTVVKVTDSEVRLLRPGAVTVEMLEQVVGNIVIDDGVLHQLDEGQQVQSPGLKYRHYAPKAQITIIDGDLDAFVAYIRAHTQPGVVALCFEQDVPSLEVPCVAYGSEHDSVSQAKALFDALRTLDHIGAMVVYARMPKRQGVGLAVYNRLLRAAGFRVVKA